MHGDKYMFVKYMFHNFSFEKWRAQLRFTTQKRVCTPCYYLKIKIFNNGLGATKVIIIVFFFCEACSSFYISQAQSAMRLSRHTSDCMIGYLMPALHFKVEGTWEFTYCAEEEPCSFLPVSQAEEHVLL